MNGKIYKVEPINNGEDGDIYIGSTTGYLCKRFYIHKYNYRYNKNNYCIFNLFNKYGIDNLKIVLIEEITYNNKRELLNREGFYIKSMNCINKNIPRTREEYKLDNKDILNERLKQWQLENKEKISQQKKIYYQLNKDKIKEKRLNKIN